MSSLLLPLVVVAQSTSGVRVEDYDVLVYSANAAGVGAAVTASDGGKYRVKVVEPLGMIGGMAAAGGVALMNQGCGIGGVTGLARNWSELCGLQYYGELGHPVIFPQMSVSEKAFWTLLNATGSVSTTTGCHAVNVSNDGGCIGDVLFACDNGDAFEIRASYVVDASYDGDIMTLAGGIDYTSGREANTTYNESLAGVNFQNHHLESFSAQNLSIDPYYPNGTLIPYVEDGPFPPAGSADDKLMAFQYFACVTPTKSNQVPFYPPPGYDPRDFELVLRVISGVIENGRYPNGPPMSYFGDVQCYDDIVEKTTGNRDCLVCCGASPVDADQPGLNQGWADAGYDERLRMAERHRYYNQGLLYFLANDPRVPNDTRANAQGYGYCKDEYTRFDNFPPQLYVRISNRLQGETILTQNNIANPRNKPDGVAMGCWTFDQHTMSRRARPSAKDPSKYVVENEGFFRAPLSESGQNWYDVPYSAMSPKRGQATNLLVPVTISASSVAYASTRIENMFMDLGSAAGVAIAQLLDRQGGSIGSQCPSIPVQDVNVTAVQDVLVSVYNQRVHGPVSPPTPAKYIVSGAGSSDWNGNYAITGETADGRPVYVYVSGSNSKALYSYEGVWRLAVENKEVFYVAGSATPSLDNTPPLTGWLVANASAPAPQLTPSA